MCGCLTLCAAWMDFGCYVEVDWALQLHATMHHIIMTVRVYNGIMSHSSMLTEHRWWVPAAVNVSRAHATRRGERCFGQLLSVGYRLAAAAAVSSAINYTMNNQRSANPV